MFKLPYFKIMVYQVWRAFKSTYRHTHIFFLVRFYLNTS
jgi:hypothetical protein